VQAFLAAMPESWGRGLELRPTKYPLKWVLQHLVDYPLHLQTGPHSYLYDVDPGFSHSAEILYGSAFTPLLKERLRLRAYRMVLSADYFDLDYIDRVVGEYRAGKETRGAELNDLMALALLTLADWHRPARRPAARRALAAVGR
jgi:hypothetical protein